VDVTIPARVLAEKLTMAGLEVTSLEEKDGEYIFETEITSNRPDWLSIVGIAREVAAITGAKFKLSQATSHKPQAKNLRPAACGLMPISIKVEDKKDCPLYTAKIIRDVKVKPSPEWLRKRLELIGCRSVNNVVDITNYILFTWGEPLHAFDLDKFNSQRIIVRRADSQEKITAIDGSQKLLNKEILVIADNKRPVAIAGVMGGKDTEVGENSKNILLEAAVFHPVVIRHARQKLAMQTESSYRFERGIDRKTAESASWIAVKLIQELAGGKFICAKSVGLKVARARMINLDTARVNKILGLNIPPAKIKTILTHLGFSLEAKKKTIFAIAVPANRPDIKLEIDLIEEVARIFGYEKIPSSLPAVRPRLALCATRDLISLIKNILIGLGSQEVITYGLISKELLKGIKPSDAALIEILNPLSKEQEVLRPTLIASLGRAVAYNLNQKQDRINIFEIAKVFSKKDSRPEEKLALAMALCAGKSDLGPLHLKGLLEALFKRLGIADYAFVAAGNRQVQVNVGKEKAGVMHALSPEALSNLDIKNKEVWVVELFLEKIFPCVNLKKKFVELPIYPAISRDISLVLKDDITAQEIILAIKKDASGLLKEAEVIDYYKGKQIALGFKGLTISCVYRSDTRTLTEAEVDPVHSSIVALLKERFSAKIRG